MFEIFVLKYSHIKHENVKTLKIFVPHTEICNFFRWTFPDMKYIIMQEMLRAYTNADEIKPSSHCNNSNPELDS